jgi:hypothetical protein
MPSCVMYTPAPQVLSSYPASDARAVLCCSVSSVDDMRPSICCYRVRESERRPSLFPLLIRTARVPPLVQVMLHHRLGGDELDIEWCERDGVMRVSATLGVEVALDAVINEGNETRCDDDTEVVC